MSLRIADLRHVYTSPTGEERVVLALEAWTLEEGAQVLLRGVSGSGKTTLFNILAGLLRPTAGEVWLEEQALFGLSESARDRFRARHIGYVFQNHHLLANFSALENVVMPLAFAGVVPSRDWRKRAMSLLDAVGLASHAHALPARMSTGQRLRVAIARALVSTPPLLLADEPTAALDPQAGAAVLTLLQTVCRQHNAILLIASHDPALSDAFETTLYLQAGVLHRQEVSA